MLPKLPLGLQDFRKLREQGYRYVDKTEMICKIAQAGGYYFLSRPRRFGKSLLTSTLKELYSGDKELFKGLWAENNWDWGKRNPVVHLSFSGIGTADLGLVKAIEQMIALQAEHHGIQLDTQGIAPRFGDLIRKLAGQSGHVVLLIDEYDKPIIDFMEDLEQAKANRSILKNFYSVIKDSDPYLELVFITGVSKFSKVSIFSDLNNLNDISLDERYGTLCGYTQAELENDFEGHIGALADKLGIERKDCLDLLKEWYNGYNFLGMERVYNPWSILSCFDKLSVKNYWFISGTPSFLINILKDKFYSDLDDIKVDDSGFESYELENLDVVPLLYQTGYLTIQSQDRDIYTLTYPNREVKASMLRHLIGAFRHDVTRNTAPMVRLLETAFQGNDLPEVISIINTAFSSIPFPIFDANSEGYYHTIIHLIFNYLGLDVRCEVANNKGRLDAIVHTETHIYIFEFKLNKSADIALAQIRDNGYAKPYLHSGKEVVLVGVNFDGKQKCVGEWKVGS